MFGGSALLEGKGRQKRSRGLGRLGRFVAQRRKSSDLRFELAAPAPGRRLLDRDRVRFCRCSIRCHHVRNQSLVAEPANAVIPHLWLACSALNRPWLEARRLDRGEAGGATHDLGSSAMWQSRKRSRLLLSNNGYGLVPSDSAALAQRRMRGLYGMEGIHPGANPFRRVGTQDFKLLDHFLSAPREPV